MIVLTVIGTRPEAIKLAPIILALRDSSHFVSKILVTGQHTDLLKPILSRLEIVPDYEFDKGERDGSLSTMAAKLLQSSGEVLRDLKPDLVLVQGDTTTAFSAALAAFYAQIPIAHVEAGLRTGRLNSPWPEEGHRVLIDRLSSYFFAPTKDAREALVSEGVSSEKIWVVGNTSMDALRILQKPQKATAKERKILVTIHRRENRGKPLKEICQALYIIANQFQNIEITLLLHPNPEFQQPVKEILSHVKNIHLRAPVDHTTFIELLQESLFVITDSGGVQEEAPFIGKPVLIIRDTTERAEGIRAGTARLVGTKSEDLIRNCRELLEDDQLLATMSKVHFPYGDGYAAERIVKILENNLCGVLL